MNARLHIASLVAVALLAPLLVLPAHAFNCPLNGGARAAAPGNQTGLAVTSYDGFDATIMYLVWRDERNLAATGADIWWSEVFSCVPDDPAGGAPVVEAPKQQDEPAVAVTGQACTGLPPCFPQYTFGVVVAWQDARGADLDLYARRVNKNATPWDTTEVAICTAPGDQIRVSVAGEDPRGRTVFAWMDRRGSDYDIYAQSVDSAGTALWTLNGIPVCAAAGPQRDVQVFRVVGGGALLVWMDARDGGSALYATRLLEDGTRAPGWSADGNPVAALPAVAFRYRAVPDRAGGLFVAWTDIRLGDFDDIRLQHIQGNGALDPDFPTDGRVVAGGLYGERVADVAADGSGGAYVVWEDDRNLGPDPSNDDVFALRVTGEGTLAPGWPAGGVAVCDAPGAQSEVRAVSVLGGLAASWSDLRSGEYDIYALKIDSTGAVAPGWMPNGTWVCGAPDAQSFPAMVADQRGGILVGWLDYRDRATNGADIYANSVSYNGIVDVPRTLAASSVGGAWPNPSRGGAQFTVTLDRAGAADIRVVDLLGRTLRSWPARVLPAGTHRLDWDGRDDRGALVPAGVYFIRSRADAGTSRRIVIVR